MTAPLHRADVTAAFVTAAEASTLPVGDGRVPNPQPAPNKAYLIVYELPGVYRDSDAEGLQDGAEMPYQVTGVGQLRDQATMAADKARDVLTAAALQALLGSTWRVAVCESTGPAPAVAQRGTRAELFNAPETYTVVVYRAG